MEPVFSNGLYLANLAVSSNMLIDSWHAISEHRREEPGTFINNHPDYRIIAIIGSSISDLKKPSAAFSLCNSLPDEFIEQRNEITNSFKTEERRKEDHIPYIITGDCLNGSVASHFTLSLLKTLDQSKYKLPLCITFGSPLFADTAFQQAISCNSTWNSCFLHVVHKDDCVPRLIRTTGQSSQKPFGTLLLCSKSGYACFQDPESIIELFKYESPTILPANPKFPTSDYENVVKRSKKIPFHGNVSSFPGHAAFLSNEANSYKAGIAAQVLAAGLWDPQQNEGSDGVLDNIEEPEKDVIKQPMEKFDPAKELDDLIDKVEKHEKDVIKRQMEEFDPAKELGEMKVYLAFLEWYINKCRASDRGSGYYDSFKNAQEQRDISVDKYKTYLTVYWEKVVEHAEKQPQLPSERLQKKWLNGGTNYRRIVEPLDIAEYYSRGRKDYITRGRSKHYVRLEEWLKDHHKKTSEESEKAREKGKETQGGPPKSKVPNVTEDSCFWAHVEDAIWSCRSVDRARARSSDDAEDNKPFNFEDYVMNLIKEQKVSSDIFLEKSSYMQWWREYQEILNEKPKEVYNSHPTDLVSYMMKGDYKKYGDPSPINSTVNPSDKSHLGPSTSGDPQG